MAKAIVCIDTTQVISGIATISYAVSVIGPPTYSYSSDYTVDTAISVVANLLSWRNKVIAQAAERGVTLLVADVIVFGAPA